MIEKCENTKTPVIADIAGMGYDLFGPRAKSTCAALVFGSISSFGSNYNCNAIYLCSLALQAILLCLLIT
ncbi:hypothetical protein RHMOL_Rhmol01G0054400 [Rhododendron molle]|uniref:Uncharacterized protein n=1 Tax=Rhododendron molle TaxID=49168 RepID=A0ACC0Q115_RHOML|nr:hypothetical protein RHMOL_Rhmol01G0054400 [Rhododendron molle]